MRFYRGMALLLVMLQCSLFPSIAQQRVDVRGVILGQDGKPMRQAHAHLQGVPWESEKVRSYSINAQPDGSWSFRVPVGLYKVSFTGVDHRRSGERLARITAHGDNSFRAQLLLNPYFTPAMLDTVTLYYRIIGEESGELPMQRLPDGRYRAMLPCPIETRTVLYNLEGIMTRRVVNGTQSSGFLYDNDGDYLSTVECRKGQDSVEVMFDPALLPRSEEVWVLPDVQGAPFEDTLVLGMLEMESLLAELRSISNPDAENSEEWLDTVHVNEGGQMWREARAPLLKPNAASHTQDGEYFVIFIDTLRVKNRLAAEQGRIAAATAREVTRYETALMAGGDVEQALAGIRVMMAASWLDKDTLFQFREPVRRICSTIHGGSPYWSLMPGVRAAQALPEPPRRDFLCSILWNQRKGGLLRSAARLLGEDFIAHGDTSAARQLLDSLSLRDEFRSYHVPLTRLWFGSEEARRVQIREMKERVADMLRFNMYKQQEASGYYGLVGTRIPAFLLRKLNAETEVRSEELTGSPYLIVTRIHGADTELLLDALREVEKDYGDRGLRVFLCVNEKDSLRYWFKHPFLHQAGWVMDRQRVPFSINDVHPDPTAPTSFMLLVDAKGVIRGAGDFVEEEVLFNELKHLFDNP